MAGQRKKASSRKNENIRSELVKDLLALALFAVGVFIAVCLWQAPASAANSLLGAIGYGVYQAAQLLFGQGKWLPVAALLLLGAGGWLKAAQPGLVLYIAYTVLTFSGCAIVHLRLPAAQQLLEFGLHGLGGGVIGGALLLGSNKLIGETVSWIL